MSTQRPLSPRTRRRLRPVTALVAATGTAAMLAACATTAPSPEGDPSGDLNAMAVEVHRNFITGESGAGINVLDQCEPPVAEPGWQLVQYTDLQQLAFREATLGSTDNSLMFLLDSWASPRMVSLLEPLTAYQEENPIDDIDGISPELFAPFESDGEFYGVPIRTTAVVLMYDEEKVPDAPATLDEVVSTAIAASGESSDGQRQYGIRYSSVDDLIAWVRAYGGELITADLELELTSEPVIEALTTLNGMYEAGAIPENFSSLSADDWLRMEQQGQVAMTLRGSTYYANLNDPDASRIAGQVGVTAFPGVDGEPVDVPAATWYMTIPANATDKDAAWEFIRCVSSPESTVSMALNNNTPVRAEAFADSEVAEATPEPLRDAQQEVVAVARPGLPGFDGQAEAIGILTEAMAAAISGQMTPEEAMAGAEEQIQPLLDEAAE